MIGKNIYTERDLSSLSELYHKNTRLSRWNAQEYSARIEAFYTLVDDPASGMGKRGKTYPGAPSIALPQESGKNPRIFVDVVRSRRTPRAFNGKQITLEQLSFILRCSAGVTERGGVLRAHPSGGALYPLELYVAAFDVAGLENGLYHHYVCGHFLNKLGSCCTRAQFSAFLFAEHLVEDSSAALFIALNFYRTEIKYGQRGYRLALLEAGHLAQNILLSATAEGLAAVPLGGFFDDEVDSVFGLDGIEETVVYPVLLGGAYEDAHVRSC